MRLAVHQHRSDGFRRNLTWQRDTNARDERMARLRVTANPGGAWRWEGALLHSRVANGYDEFALDNNGRNTFSNRPGRDEQRSAAASLRGTYRGGAATRFTTVSQASRVDSVYSYDDDWTAASYDGFSDLRRRREVFSEELRLDSAVARGALPGLDRWTLGAHLARTTEASAYTNEDPGNLRGLTTSYESTQGALFGQGGRDLTPHTRLIVGLRAEWVDLAGEGVRTRYRKARGTHDPVVRFRPGFSGALPGGKLSLEHDLSPQHLAFLSVTRGYKAGGINVDARINPPADPLTYATETLWNFEAGLRGSWADRRLVGECTAFRLERRDPQVRDSAGFGGNYRFFTANGRKASVSGAEASGTWTFNRAWSAQASAAWMESELQPFVLPNGHAGGGRALANTPRHGHTLALRYRGDTGLFGRIEQVGRARQYDSNNQNEARRAFRVLNATLGWSWGRAWTVAVWGRNLLDVRYEKRVFFFGNEDPDYPERRYEDRADPRQVGATVTFRF